jgi:hypothetical protein
MQGSTPSDSISPTFFSSPFNILPSTFTFDPHLSDSVTLESLSFPELLKLTTSEFCSNILHCIVSSLPLSEAQLCLVRLLEEIVWRGCLAVDIYAENPFYPLFSKCGIVDYYGSLFSARDFSQGDVLTSALSNEMLISSSLAYVYVCKHRDIDTSAVTLLSSLFDRFTKSATFPDPELKRFSNIVTALRCVCDTSGFCSPFSSTPHISLSFQTQSSFFL